MSDHIIYLSETLSGALNVTEKFQLIDLIFEGLNEENKEKFDQIPSTKVLKCAFEFLKLQNLIKDDNSDIIIRALKKMDKKNLAMKLILKDYSFQNDFNVEKMCLEEKIEANYIEINKLKVPLKFKPFKFQISLAQKSCDRKNNIICSKTGSGKTLIAAIICKYWDMKFIEKNKNIKIAFLVPTRHLVQQQCSAFQNAFDPDDLKEITESMKNIEAYSSKKCLFMTPQKLLNSLTNSKSVNKMKITDFDLIIFDEAHHATEDHPYNQIMSIYFNQITSKNKQNAPLIIGLTASLGIGVTNSAVLHLLKLIANLDCTDISSTNKIEDIKDLNLNISSPLEDKIYSINQMNNYKDLNHKIADTILKIGSKGNISLDRNINGKNYDNDVVEILEILGGPKIEQDLVNYKMKAEATENRNMIIALKYIMELNLIFTRLQDLSIDFCIKLMIDFYEKNCVEDPLEFEIFARNQFESLIEYMKANRTKFYINKKIKIMCDLIKMNHKTDSKGLILVRTRLHTKALYEYFIELDLKDPIIKPCILTGQGSADNLLMNESDQRDIIEKFRDGHKNLMIATDIAQEGLDVPTCQYVIRYEFVSNEIGTVQSRGRARAKNGQCCLITSTNSLNEKRELKNRDKESEMNIALKQFNKLDNKFFQDNYEFFKDQKIKESIVYQQGFKSTSTNISSPKIYNSNSIKVRCKDCNKELFKGSDIKYREPSYFCKNSKFIDECITVNPQSKKFYCSDKSCNKELGRLVEFKNKSPLHMIEIKGIKFFTPHQDYIIGVNQWSKVAQYFHIDISE